MSSNSLARDLQKSPNTVQSWLRLLEDLYVIFRVTPYHRNIARALLKEPKFYFYDNGMVLGDEGVKLENLVACALLKELHRATDVDGENLGLHYIRNKDGQEIDFLISRDGKAAMMIESKWSDSRLSPCFNKFLRELDLKRIQVVGTLAQSKSYPGGERIEPAHAFLEKLSLSS